MVQRARRSVGATIQAARAALAGEGVAANLAGGTHHAYPHKGSGYCVFNDVAVAARLMQAEWHANNDNSCGGGIDRRAPGRHRSDLRDDDTVFTLLHETETRCARAERLDIELPDGHRRTYLGNLDGALAALYGTMRPYRRVWCDCRCRCP
jgi:hypothetical protein